MSTLPCYQKSSCCGGADCDALDDDENEPCWGRVECTAEIPCGDGGHYWAHECQGHNGRADYGDPYKRKPQ